MKTYKFYFQNIPKKGVFGVGMLIVAAKNKTEAIKVAKNDWKVWAFEGEIKNITSNVKTAQIVERLQYIE